MNSEQFLNFRNFYEDFITWFSYRSSSLFRRSDENGYKDDFIYFK